MGKGKSKIEIKKIESLGPRNVCFSKRRKGLFKKASELGRIFPDVSIAAVVFSPAGNPYVFGDPVVLLEENSSSEINNLLIADIESMGLEDLKKYRSRLEKFKSELLTGMDKEIQEEQDQNFEDVGFTDEEIEALMKDWQGGSNDFQCMGAKTEWQGGSQDSGVTCPVWSVPVETSFNFSGIDDEEEFVNQFLNV